MSLSELKRTPSRPAAPRVELHKEMQKENNNTLRNCKLNPNKILIAPAARELLELEYLELKQMVGFSVFYEVSRCNSVAYRVPLVIVPCADINTRYQVSGIRYNRFNQLLYQDPPSQIADRSLVMAQARWDAGTAPVPYTSGQWQRMRSRHCNFEKRRSASRSDRRIGGSDWRSVQ